MELAKLRLKRAESAQKRFTGAVKALTLVRALVPKGVSIPALLAPGDGNR